MISLPLINNTWQYEFHHFILVIHQFKPINGPWVRMHIVITIKNMRDLAGRRVLHCADTSHVYPEIKLYFLVDLKFGKRNWFDSYVDANVAEMRLCEFL
jgi:hypothetical protein